MKSGRWGQSNGDMAHMKCLCVCVCFGEGGTLGREGCSVARGGQAHHEKGGANRKLEHGCVKGVARWPSLRQRRKKKKASEGREKL